MKINPILIGSLKVDFPVMLSPMAGYTDLAFRSIANDMHCGMTYTEVINARGIYHDSKLTMHMLEESKKNSTPVAAHIYGSEPEIMAKAASIIEKLDLYDSIDVNCGCPVRKIVSKGAGAALINNPDAIHAIVSTIKKAISLPVTIKTRTGPTPDFLNISDILNAAEEAGADAIAIHSRPTSQKHGGPADWKTLARIKSEASIPVFGNGGIECANDVFSMIKETGVDGVLIGRAAIGNPWIFNEIHCIANGIKHEDHSLKEHKEIMIEHLDRLIILNASHPKFRRKKHGSPEKGAARHFRGHMFKYLSGFHGWNRIKLNLESMNSRESIIDAIDSVIQV